MTNKKRVELYRRLPEIYRIKDEGLPENYLHKGKPVEAFQLRSYLAPVEDMFSAIHENIESLYHDLFIETCDDWVIPYIGDLLGTTHLSGDQWTLRADVADTIKLRRRKGTLGAIELLAFILTKWGVHSVELLENMVWNQNLNHQRPDEGGTPPYSLPTVLRSTPIRGGTVTLRDPSALAQLNTPFDPFAHVADVRRHEIGQIRYNLPNLAIYLWRLKAYRLNVIQPRTEKVIPALGAARVVRINVDPVPLNILSNDYVKPVNQPAGRPVTLFNTGRNEIVNRKRSGADKLDLSAIAPRVSTSDQVPGPIPTARISDFDIAQAYDKSLASPNPLPFAAFADASFTAPQEYLSVASYDPTVNTVKPLDDLKSLIISDVGLQLHLPEPEFAGENWLHTTKNSRKWTIRGENLCSWERGINPPLADRQIAIDPVRGRICMGVDAAAGFTADKRADALVNDLLLTFTYGAVGEVGAHPVSYPALPKEFDHLQTPGVVYLAVDLRQDEFGLQKALQGIAARTSPTVIEIVDSRTHTLDIASLPAADRIKENGVVSIKLNAPLIIRAADGRRPIIELAKPLAFRPANIVGANAPQQKQFDAVMDAMFVRLEGLYIARGLKYGASLPLIARAALNRLEILNCTLDPGGFRRFDGTRAPLLPGIGLDNHYGFGPPNPVAAAEELAFKQKPDIIIQRSVTGAVFTDEGYSLCITDSIIESIPVKIGVNTFSFAITGATDPADGFAGPTVVKNVTILGRVRSYSIEGNGVIFTGILEAFDQQAGCLKYCYFADDSVVALPQNRLPQNFACVNGRDARLIFTSEYFGDPAFCQISLECDPRILEEGSGSDQMGAYNFLLEAHKWRNLKIRFREFMPVGIRPLLIPVT